MRPVAGAAVVEVEACGCVVVVEEAPPAGVVEAAGAPKENPDLAAGAAVVEFEGVVVVVAVAVAGAGVVEDVPAAGVAGLPKENPPVVAGLSAGLSDAAPAAGLGAPKLKPPAAGAAAAQEGDVVRIMQIDIAEARSDRTYLAWSCPKAQEYHPS